MHLRHIRALTLIHVTQCKVINLYRYPIHIKKINRYNINYVRG